MKKLSALVLVVVLLFGLVACGDETKTVETSLDTTGTFDMQAVENYTNPRDDAGFHGDCFGLHPSVEEQLVTGVKESEAVVIARYVDEHKVGYRKYAEFQVLECLKGDVAKDTILVCSEWPENTCNCFRGRVYNKGDVRIICLSPQKNVYLAKQHNPNFELPLYEDYHNHESSHRYELHYIDLEACKKSDGDDFEYFYNQYYKYAIAEDQVWLDIVKDALTDTEGQAEKTSVYKYSNDIKTIIANSDAVVRMRIIKPEKYDQRGNLSIRCRCEVIYRYYGESNADEIYISMSPLDFVKEKSHEYIVCLKNRIKNDEYVYTSVQSVFDVDKEPEIKQIIAKQK